MNPCIGATELCCLRDANRLYRNDALWRIQNDTCVTTLEGDFITGSRNGITTNAKGFSAVVPIDTAWVAFLFIHWSPFFIVGSVERISVLSLAVPPCRLPANARFVTGCVWECEQGYTRDAFGCTRELPLHWIIVAVTFIIVTVLAFIMFRFLSRKEKALEIETTTHSTVIQFKDNHTPLPADLRLKFS